ncbi:T9SS type A sorting domain-containing protein [Hymenobacter nivis]|nr:T9SS type A sorting domain-containing protein [Hymenobacter nivis]
MYYSNLTFARTFQRLVCVLILLLVAVAGSLAQTVLPRAYYSKGSTGALYPASPVLTGGGSISLGTSGAAIAAVVTTDTGNPVTLRLPLVGGPAPAGYRAGMLLANTSGIGGSALGATTMRTYLGGVLQESHVVDATLLQTNLLGAGSDPTPVDFVTIKPFDAVEVTIANAANLNFKTNVYNAYGVVGASQVPLLGALSRFATPNDTKYSSTAYKLDGNKLVQACVNSSVGNPDRAVDMDLTNYATFGSFATVSCPPTLRVKLEGPASPAGYYAGFMVGNAGLLDANVLSGVRIRTFLNGVPQETNTDASLLQLNVLPGGQTRVGFPTTLPFDAVSIERTSTVSVLDNMQLYYGFGLEPRAFGQAKQVISDFTTTTNRATGSAASRVCVAIVCVDLAAVANPENAASANPNDFAQFATVLGVGNSQFLKVDLNGNGLAGNRAGMVVGPGAGLLTGALLDVSVLKNLTLSTYDAAGKLVESAAASDLLSIGLLPNGRTEVSFLTTKSFSSVRLDVVGGVTALSGMKVFNAFADDPQAVLPVVFVAPLPVVLTDFTGRRTATGANLAWATASEHNSSQFVIERRGGSAAEFQAVGQVAAAGNSSEAHRYQYTDASAAAMGSTTLYYRLRQVDVDGTIAYSPVVALAGGALASSGLQVYPNPALASAPVSLRYEGAGAVSASVYSEMGQLVRQVPLAAEAGAVATLPTLPTGLYHVVVRDAAGNRVATQRLVVAQ